MRVVMAVNDESNVEIPVGDDIRQWGGEGTTDACGPANHKHMGSILWGKTNRKGT